MPSFTGIPPQGGTMASVNNYNAATNHINGASYDAAGNLTGLTGMILDYDAENRQKVAYDTIYGLMLYLYDGSGQRIEKKYPDASFGVYVYDAFGQLAAEYYSDVPAPPPCTTCYLSWDHLGSARLVTDQWGNMVSRHDYLPFGEEIASGSAGRNSDFGQSDNVNQKFTGQEHDSELGLDFFNMRYFSAGLGRFTSPDPMNAGANPANPQSWNGYSYVLGNPLGLIDPSGLDTCAAGSENTCVDVSDSFDPVPIDLCFYPNCSGYVTGEPSGSTEQPVQQKQPPLVMHVFGPAKTGTCIAPSALQRNILPIQAATAKFWGRTLLAGLGASGGAGLGKGIGVYGSASAQIAVSPNGNAAYALTFAAPASVSGAGTYAWVTPSTKGFGFLGGAQFGVSNVSDPSQLAGPSYDASTSAAAGVGMGGDLSAGDGSWQFNITLGFGIGGRGSAGARTYTAVVPICGSW
jgi:RHS repeat-associated protein